jgi:hypothetical protein
LPDNPEEAFNGSGNKYKDQARIAELERLHPISAYTGIDFQVASCEVFE